jgi:hypothetical protein
MVNLKRLLINILLFPVMPIFGALTGNITTDTTELIGAFYDKTALEAEQPYLILHQFAVKTKDIPKYNSPTVYWWKTIPLAVTVSPLTEGSSPAATDLEFQRSTATVTIHGKVVALSEFLQMTAIDPEMKSAAATLGIHRGKYRDLMYWEELVKRLYPMRIDADSTYETALTADASGSTTTIVDTTLTQAANFFLGGVVVITAGNNKGMGGYCTDFVATTTTLTFTPAVNEATGTSDVYKLATSTGITAADPLTCAGVAKGVVILQSNHSVPLDDGYYGGVLSPFTEYDIRNDSAWINADEYAGSKKLYNGEMGTWGMTRFVRDTVPWRSTAGTMGTYVATGAVFHTPIFGKECYAGVGIQGAEPQLIIHPKERTADSLEMYSTMGWKAFLVCKVLNACWGIQIISGATSIS